MYQSVLLPIHPDNPLNSAVVRGLSIARTFEATVHVVTAVEPYPTVPDLPTADREALEQTAKDRGTAALDRVAAEAETNGLTVLSEIRSGPPHQVVREYAEAHAIDLIAMGTRGFQSSEPVRLGSTTDRVITHADTPVLTTHLTPGEPTPDVEAVSFDPILIPTDGSDYAASAADHALALAEAYDATVHALYVIDTTTYTLKDAPRSIIGLLRQGGQNATTDIATDAQDRGLTARTEIRRGTPHAEILEYADDTNANLIAMGTRGLDATPDHIIGSTTNHLLRRTHHPTLTIN